MIMVATRRKLDVVGDHRGLASIDAYTVAHEGGEPRYATALGRTGDDRRVVVRCDDTEVAAAMTGEELCGREVIVDGGRFRPDP